MVVLLKLTQHCKPTILQFKNKYILKCLKQSVQGARTKDANQNSLFFFFFLALDSWKVTQRSKPPLRKKPCTYCKEEEHWEMDCPQLKQKKTRGAPVVERENTLNKEAQGLPWTYCAQFPTGVRGKIEHRGWNDWRQKEKGAAEDEMFRWCHKLNSREFRWDSGGQRSLACCSPWGRKEPDMT